MIRKELDRKLLKNGWIIRHGSSHDLAVNPDGRILSLPRHKGDLKTGTLKNILKAAGLD